MEDERVEKQMQLKQEEINQRTKDYLKKMRSGSADNSAVQLGSFRREERQKYLEELIQEEEQRKEKVAEKVHKKIISASTGRLESSREVSRNAS